MRVEEPSASRSFERQRTWQSGTIGSRLTQPGHRPANDRESGSGISHRAGWWQDSAFFLGTACRQKWQLTEIFGAYELKSIAIQ
jgi:hypothetical protein